MIKNPDTSDLNSGCGDQEDINDDFYFIEYREAEQKARDEEKMRRFTDDFWGLAEFFQCDTIELGNETKLIF